MYKGETYFLNKFEFTNTAETNGNKTLKIKSDFLDADISELTRDTGWRPEISFEEGIREVIEFYRTWGEDA